jgi:hypothetical protein
MDQVLEIALERMPHPLPKNGDEQASAERRPEPGTGDTEVSISAH